MIQVRHRLASGRLSEAWEFDPARGTLDVVLQQGSAEPLGLTIHVCGVDSPRLGAFAVSRLDGDSWRVLPAQYVFAGGRLVYRDAPIHESLGMSMLVLTHAPAEVDEELSRL